MQSFKNRIITASAGTGKTYRLSIEYLKLILNYFEQPDFAPDNILVLTFTRKATAEIRQRIMESLEMLLNRDHPKAAERQSLIRSVRGSEDLDELETRDYNILLSVNRMISNDKKLLQVMTLDSYISSIFRNIVRPLRSIDIYEIDTEAARKRLPDILNELMQPQLKQRIDKLLRRKIKPSLDEYENFFISLINRRWFYYLIKKRLQLSPEEGLQLDLASADETGMKARKAELSSIFEEMLELIVPVQEREAHLLPDYFSKKFKTLLGGRPEESHDFMTAFTKLLSHPRRLYGIMDVLKDKDGKPSNLYNGSKFTKKIDLEIKNALQDRQQELKSRIADYLILSLVKPEQDEIMELWGEVLAIYDRFIYRYRNMSYDDIAWFTFEALYSEEPPIFAAQDAALANEFYQFLTHRSRFILIDEFQDTSLIQFNILKPIIDEVCSGAGTKDYGGLVVVGDEKQSIFGWRGGERDLLGNLPEIIKSLGEVEVETLDQSWRSSPFLMKYINSIFHHADIQTHLTKREMSWKYDQDITSMKPELEAQSELEFVAHPYQPKGKGDYDIDDVYSDFVAKMIKPIHDKHPDESIAILCRKTKELTELQLILDKEGITSVFEPSADLLSHHLVAPLISWLRFLAYGDVYRLLELLRSDYILIHSPQLKTVLEALSKAVTKSGYLPLDAEPGELPIVRELLSLATELQGKGLHEACMAIVNRFLTDAASGPRDLSNLHAFLVVAREYELEQSGKGLGIPDFLDYLQQNIRQDFLKQRSIDDKGTLQLLTIHKSKGLQFDRVFVYYNLAATHARDYGHLNTYLQYQGKDFQNVRDFALTLHYGSLLKASQYAYLVETAKARELLEEMNSLYVAFTRAETKLHIYFAFPSKGSWQEYLDGRIENDKLALPDLLCKLSLDFMQDNHATATELGYQLLPDNPEPLKEKKDKDELKTEQPDLSSVLADPKSKPMFLAQPQPPAKDWHRLWLTEQANLIGDLVHFYLSQLLRNSAPEQERGLLHALKDYGSIIPQARIRAIIEQVNKDLQRFPELFDKRYDLVFNEKTIWLGSRELRIDRMQVCTNSREILLVDYKTGEIHDREQLELYTKSLRELPWVQKLDYRIDSRFIELNL